MLFTVPKTVVTGTKTEYEINAAATAGGSYDITADCGANTILEDAGIVGSKALKLRSLNNRKPNAMYNFGDVDDTETLTVKIISGDKTYLNEKITIIYDGSEGGTSDTVFSVNSLNNTQWWRVMENRDRSDKDTIVEKDRGKGMYFKVISGT